MNNTIIRMTLAETGLKYWELSRLLNISEATLSRRLRDELPAEEQDRIVDLIRQHTKTGGGDDE